MARWMMADEYHTVYIPANTRHGKQVFSSKLHELEEKGWKAGTQRRGISDDEVIDVATGRRLRLASYDYWNAKGKDAWVSVKTYPTPKEFEVRE